MKKPGATPQAHAHAASSDSAGLEAGIIFLMVFVFLGIIFLNGIYGPSGAQEGVDAARSAYERGDVTAALALARSVLEQYPQHEGARSIADKAEKDLDAQEKARESERERARLDAEGRAAAERRVVELEAEIASVRVSLEDQSKSRQAAETTSQMMADQVARLDRELADARAATAAVERRLADAEAVKRQEAAVSAAQIAELERQLAAGRQDMARAGAEAEAATARARGMATELEQAIAGRTQAEEALGAAERRATKLAADLDAATQTAKAAADRIEAADKAVNQLRREAKARASGGEHIRALDLFRALATLVPGDAEAAAGIEAANKAIKEAEAETPETPAAPAGDPK